MLGKLNKGQNPMQWALAFTAEETPTAPVQKSPLSFEDWKLSYFLWRKLVIIFFCSSRFYIYSLSSFPPSLYTFYSAEDMFISYLSAHSTWFLNVHACMGYRQQTHNVILPNLFSPSLELKAQYSHQSSFHSESSPWDKNSNNQFLLMTCTNVLARLLLHAFHTSHS